MAASEFIKLKKSNCKNCYKCIRNCPVKAIQVADDHAQIIAEECILCGQCYVSCPQNAKEITSSISKVRALLAEGTPVIASIAPSFIANYPGCGIETLNRALRALGFQTAEETAVAATLVKNKYDELLNGGDYSILISSCCQSVNLLIQKHFPHLLKYLAPILSPMQTHALLLKKNYPGAKVVFIGPCISKKDEAQRSRGLVDAALTFGELSDWLDMEDISLSASLDKNEHSLTRLFPTTGGLLKTMPKHKSNYTYIAVDGMENCLAALRDIEKGRISNCFIELSACSGCCVGGPAMEKIPFSPIQDYFHVASYAGEEDFIVETPEGEDLKRTFAFLGTDKQLPPRDEIDKILRRMGKTKPEHELNCASCGYESCREKAIAVYQGKADLTMCLPYLKESAETVSNIIIRNTSDGIIVLDEELDIRQLNRAAEKMIRAYGEVPAVGEPAPKIIASMLEPARQSRRNPYRERCFLDAYGKYVDKTIFYDPASHLTVCTLKEVADSL